MSTVGSSPAIGRPQAVVPPAQMQRLPEDPSQAVGTAEAPAEAAAPMAPVKQGRSLFGHFADIFVGGGEAILDMAKGVGTLIAHPIQTVKGLGYAITHPATLVHAFVDPYMQAIAEGRPGKALGRGIVEIGSFFITGGGGGAASGTAKGATMSAKAASIPARVGNAVSRIGALTLKEVALVPFKLPGLAVQGARGVLAAANPVRLAANIGVAAGKLGALTIAELLGGAVRLPGTIARVALTNPAALVRPAAAIGMANRVGQGALALAQGTSLDPNNAVASLTDDQAAEIAQKYGLQPTRENVAAFIAEVQGYNGNTIGPDAGTPEQVKQLQTVLRAYGYDVDPNGTFDDKTAQAVIDFKTNHGITQGYSLADGNPAVNEYVDEGTAKALVDAVKAGEHAGDRPAPSGTEPTGTEPTGTEPTGTEPIGTEPTGTAPTSLPEYAVVPSDRAAGLSGIARRYLGDSGRWKEIYELNKDVIGDNPNMILPGQTLKLPADAKGLPGQETKQAPAPKTPASAQPQPKPASAKPAAKPATEPAAEPATEPAAEPATGLSDQQIASLAKEYGLLPTRSNVEAFSREVNSYREAAVGPDVGDAATIKRLQAILAKLGFAVRETGTFDDATSKAVVDFKVGQGLHQGYKLANGDFAINEYVDEATAQTLVEALNVN